MKSLKPPIQESDISFDTSHLRVEGSYPEKRFHDIYSYGNKPSKKPGLFRSDSPFIDSSSFEIILDKTEAIDSSVEQMLDLDPNTNKYHEWKGKDLKSAKELAQKWLNPYSQNHFKATIDLIAENIDPNKNTTILELGTGTGLFTTILIDQMLKRGIEKFSIVSCDINISCISLSWMLFQYFNLENKHTHTYMYSDRNLSSDYIDTYSNRHPRTLSYVPSSMSSTLACLENKSIDIVVSNHSTSYLKNKDYILVLKEIGRVLKKSGVFVEDSLNQYKLNIESDRLKSRVIRGGNRKKEPYEPEYTVIQKEKGTPYVVNIQDLASGRFCDWIRAMTFNPRLRDDLRSFQNSLKITQKTQRDLKNITPDHSEEHKQARNFKLKDITPDDFVTDLFITTKIFQKE